MEKSLINLVKEHEFLYNRKATYYKDLARKEEKWTEIAAELNIEVKKAKQRWKSLRDRFARELSKVRGSETQDVSWKYFDTLLFLKDCTEPRERNSMVKQELKTENETEINPKNINELFRTFLSENEESGQGTSGGNRIQENGNFQKAVPVLIKLERSVECTTTADEDVFNKNPHGKYLNSTTIQTVTSSENDDLNDAVQVANVNVNRSQHHHQNANFQKDNPILISFENSAITAKGDVKNVTTTDGHRFVQANALTAAHVHATATAATPTTIIQQPHNETFVRSFFNAMAIQVEQANLNFHAWATIQQEVMEVVNRNIIHSLQQNSNRLSSSYTQTQTANGIS